WRKATSPWTGFERLRDVRPYLQRRAEGPDSDVCPLCSLAPASNGWGLFRPRVNRVSRVWVWRYARPFVCNNHCCVCDCNRIGGFFRDDKLPQHLAATSPAKHPLEKTVPGQARGE